MRRHRKQDYPFIWDRIQKPANRKGHKCRIVSKLKGQGMDIVNIEFEKDGAQFAVLRKGLKKV